MSNAKPRPNVKLVEPKRGPDRRSQVETDRRVENLGGPVVEQPKLLYTREEAIELILEADLDCMRDWDDADRADLVMNGWGGKPLNKFTNRELQNRLCDDEQDDRIKVRR